MPDFFEVVARRRSVRQFLDKEVEEEKIKTILDYAILCQTAGNLQSYEIFVVRDSKTREKLARAALSQMWVASAPIVFVVCANQKRAGTYYGKRGYELYAINDASIVATYIELLACALGLGSCWVGAFDEGEVRNILNLPEGIKPIAIIPVGYPAEKPRKPAKRKDVIHWVD
jgi:nitroreductase